MMHAFLWMALNMESGGHGMTLARKMLDTKRVKSLKATAAAK
jgi:hypothetical protein